MPNMSLPFWHCFNLYSVFTQRLAQCSIYRFLCTLQAVIFLHFLWVGPVQALIVLAILWLTLGPASLAGFLLLILLIPVQGSMGRVFAALR